MLPVKKKVGLVLAALFALADLTAPISPVGGDHATGRVGPPLAVLIADAALGVVTLIAVVCAWRTAGRLGRRTVVASRILSALTALPGLFAAGVPAVVVVLVAAVVFLTVTIAVLVLGPSEAEEPQPIPAHQSGPTP